MKFALLSILSGVLFFSNRSYAQVPVVSKILPKVIVGIKAGANFQELTGSTWDNTYKAGFTGGAFVGVTKKKIGIQVEGLISTAKYNFANTNGTFIPGIGTGTLPTYVNTLNLNVPILFEYKLVTRLWLQAGPQFSDMLSAKDNKSNDIKSDFTTTDFAGVLGLQAVLPLHLTVSARYILGLTNVSNGSQTWNNRGIQLAVGYRFL